MKPFNWTHSLFDGEWERVNHYGVSVSPTTKTNYSIKCVITEIFTVLPCFLETVHSMCCLILDKVLACPCDILVDHQLRVLSAQQRSLERLQSLRKNDDIC